MWVFMKKLIIVLLLFITSAISAETKKETRDRLIVLQEQIEKSPSIQSIINNINNNLFDPIYTFDTDSGLRNEPGFSGVFNSVIKNRLSVFKPVGDQQENLELLKIVISKGIDVNKPQTLKAFAPVFAWVNPAYPFYPLMIASEVCSIPAINLLLNSGASLSVSNDFWVPALHSYNKLKGTQVEASNECRKASEFFLSKTTSFSAKEAYKQFSYDFETNDVSFIGGDVIADNYSPQMIALFAQKFNLKFSRRPMGDEPDDVWFNEFRKHLERPAINDLFDDRFKYEDWAKAWWANQSSVMRSWACYYSTIDETLSLLIDDGADIDWLINRPASGNESWKYRGYGSFAVNTFREYCTSLK